MTIQVPPAVGSSGQWIETVIVSASSEQRHVMVIGAGASTAFAPVTSSGGLLIAVSNPSTAVTVTNAATTAVTVTNISTAVTVTNLIRSLSSGTVTLSSNPTVVLSSPTSLSSGIITFSSAPTVNVSSGVFTLSSATSLSSGTVTLSSNPTVVSASSGKVQTIASTLDAVSPTFVIATTISKISSSPAVLHWMYSVITCSTLGSCYLRFYDATTSSVVMNTSVKMIMPLAITSLSSVTGGGFDPVNFLPPGMNFASGISFDAVAISTSTAAVVTANIFVTAMRV